MKKRLLLISNSTNYGENYLEWPIEYIKDFLSKKSVKRLLFIPFAGIALSEKGISDSWDVYEERVNKVFDKIGYEVYSIHHIREQVEAIKDALAIVVGGGNTFHLVYMLHKLKLMKPLASVVEKGTPYIGWSAGANIACPTMMTTNDMPVVQPDSMYTLGLVPFQINPHYLDANPEGHGGETREQRLEEYMVINNSVYVAGLRESTLLQVEGHTISLKGNRPMRVFRHGLTPKEYEPGSDINFLVE